MRYRPDVDGLRAVAVLSVVLYHLEPSWGPSGGFVGVDVFFVISGYLITGILREEADRGALSILGFYDRRIRRIFPALFVVYASCLVASAVLLFPSQTAAVGKDVLASLGFVSNVVYCHLAGYFDQTSRNALLLHTWSLSVEEQFYVVLPLLLLVLGTRLGRGRAVVLAGLSLASFVAAERMVGIEAPRAFYLMPYRAWELLLGSLLAEDVLPRITRRGTAEALGACGLALVLASTVLVGSQTPFPGLWALPPTLGALAVLYSGRDVETAVARLLGSPPLRGVGLVSYSLYLWHWPLIALARTKTGSVAHPGRLVIAAGSLALAVLSYRYVELPFRRKSGGRSLRRTFTGAAVGAACVAALALGIPRAAARYGRRVSAEDVLAYLHYPAKQVVRSGICFLTTGYDSPTLFQKDECLKLRSDRKNFLILGDSHAAHLWPGLEAAYPGVNFLQATASGCGAFIRQSGAPRCTQLFAFMFKEFLPQHHLDAIVYHGRWTVSYQREMEETVTFLRPFADRIIVLGPPVEYDEPLPQLLSRAIVLKDPALPARHLVSKIEATDRVLAKAIRRTGAEYYSMYAAACPEGTCTEWASEGVPLQYDYGHLTAPGSRLLVERLGSAVFH